MAYNRIAIGRIAIDLIKEKGEYVIFASKILGEE